jgi:hypothetical protein
MIAQAAVMAVTTTPRQMVVRVAALTSRAAVLTTQAYTGGCERIAEEFDAGLLESGLYPV